MSVNGGNSDTFWIWTFLIFGVALILFAAIYGASSPVHSEEPIFKKHRTIVKISDIHVVDGDTIKVGTVNFRLMGFDTPETFQAKCTEEFKLGKSAQTYMHKVLTEAKTIELDIKGKDKYNRSLAILYVDGVDVATIMVENKLAVPYNGKTKRQSWC